jgi:hypothetical protein
MTRKAAEQWSEFWELVVVSRREDLQYPEYNNESLRQAFVSEEVAKDRAEEDNQFRLRGIFAMGDTVRAEDAAGGPIKWKGDHHGGLRSAESPNGEADYYVFPRTVFPRMDIPRPGGQA